MPKSGPYRVLDDGNRRIVYESFAGGPRKAATLARLAESWAEANCQFCFAIVDRKTGRIFAESVPMDCGQVSEEIGAAKRMITESHRLNIRRAKSTKTLSQR